MAAPARLALTISGAVSLGAFEGGALAALLSFVQALGGAAGEQRSGRSGSGDARLPWPVTLDVMSGASAGSITAVLAARVLTSGLDPVAVMRSAWVTAPSLRTLTRGARRAPLSPEGLRAVASDLLGLPPSQPAQPADVTVHMALTALAGLRYTIPDLASGTPLEASTNLDWAEVTFSPGSPLEAWLEPPAASAVDFALASGASPLAFPPYPLNRRRRPADWETYVRNGVTGLPDDGWLWYTDGGTIENEPLGRTLDLAAQADRGWAGDRVHLLIHPHPTGGSAPGVWRGPHHPPGAWLRSLAQADRIQRTQTLFDDLRRAEKMNSRLLWRGQLQRELLALRSTLDAEDTRAFDAAIERVAAEIHADRAELRTQSGRPTSTQPGAGASSSPEEQLDAILDEIVGGGGRPVAFGIISPTAIADANRVSVEELLAGEHLFHFGGFLDERLRGHDFAIGFDAAVGWLEHAVADGGPLSGAAGPASLAAACEAVRGRRQPWSLPAPRARAGVRWQAAALAGRAAVLAARDLVACRPWRARR